MLKEPDQTCAGNRQLENHSGTVREKSKQNLEFGEACIEANSSLHETCQIRTEFIFSEDFMISREVFIEANSSLHETCQFKTQFGVSDDFMISIEGVY